MARKIVAACGRDVRTLMGDSAALRGLDPADFVEDRFGLPTVRDIMSELEKPGRDPRPAFRTATFAEGVDDIRDLKPGMVLEGTVTKSPPSVPSSTSASTRTGWFTSPQLADRFVRDAHEVVKAGDVVRVRVLDVDTRRKRIGLSMRTDERCRGKRLPRREGGRETRIRSTGATAGPRPEGENRRARSAPLLPRR